MKPECYFSVDIESAGPIPARYSMLSLGACAVEAPGEGFYVELKPISDEFVPDALRVAGFDLARLRREGREPAAAMAAFRAWVETVAAGRKPVFVGFNAAFDWQFVNWYFETFSHGNPFGFGAVDIKSFYMGLSGQPWSASTSGQLPPEFRPDTPQTHNALDDARAQASIFAKMSAAARGERR